MASPITGLLQCDSVTADEDPHDGFDVAAAVLADATADDAADDEPEEVPLELLFEGEVPTARTFALQRLSLEQLGKFVFFDEISVPKGRQGCASCHDPATGWTLRNATVNTGQVAAPGALLGAVGSIKTPSNAYARNIPLQEACAPSQLPCGGLFWDGRAEGDDTPVFGGATTHIGDEVFKGRASLENLFARYLGPLADQATQPFPNPAEQNISEQEVCKHVAKSLYSLLYLLAWGEKIDCSASGFTVSFKRIAVALAAWQSSAEVNSFSSKRDKALAAEIKLEGADVAFPLAGLTDQENRGHDLFYGKAGCALCHDNSPTVPPPDPTTSEGLAAIRRLGLEPDQLYTDAVFHNIGVPENPLIPGPEGSLGLGGRRLEDENLRGQHKTPTLRNVDKRPSKSFVKAYTHNGWFKSLESLVHFYNTADVTGATAAGFGITRCDPSESWTEAQALAANCWPEPEETGTLAIGGFFGDLALSDAEEDAIVAYLKTLTDTKTVKPPLLLQ
ncbi:cytochrome-c peroxidase [Nannocystis radixulma]|uniref:Cytochrome c peroxidase n=1 Tax=Nannocystis radixulma TaxID=2995305 RepID=A0ABT5B4M7_9BACT|nr:cytochrome c peroxidase [Nannocystis radixulma]MDC0668016.1 cytochrome c peroxidase [Nannocystis radixulma]